MLDKIKNNEVSHHKRTHGWTGQISRCAFACWWDCSFWCCNPKLNPKMNPLKGSCRVAPGCIGVPDWEECKKMRRKLK